jgi:peptide/nickel transport system permease protein
MTRVIARRLLIAIPTVFVVCTFTFLLVQLVPGNPADYILGKSATPASIQHLDAQLGLNKPVLAQYLSWLGGVLHGNFGTSYITGQTVSQALTSALSPTLSLALLATIVTIVLGQALGTIAAVRGGRLDSVVQALSGLGMAIPNFWLAALLVVAFSLEIKLFPSTGYTALGASPWQWLIGLVLPVTAIALAGLAQIVLQARSSVLDVLSKDFVRTLQAAGIPRRRILYKHVLRNSAIPVTTVAGLSFVFLLGGVVVIETIFNIPGMGSLMINSVNRHDLPVLQGAVIYFALIVVVVNLAVDLLTAWLDPRVRAR